MQPSFARQRAAVWSWRVVAPVVFGVSPVLHAAIPAAESQALVDLYNATGGTAWTNVSLPFRS